MNLVVPCTEVISVEVTFISVLLFLTGETLIANLTGYKRVTDRQNACCTRAAPDRWKEIFPQNPSMRVRCLRSRLFKCLT